MKPSNDALSEAQIANLRSFFIDMHEDPSDSYLAEVNSLCDMALASLRAAPPSSDARAVALLREAFAAGSDGMESRWYEEAEQVLSALNDTAQSASAANWAEVEKAKADAYESAACIVEEMSYPPEGQDRWPGSDSEWAAIKLEDAARAIRERKAKMCHVTHAAVDRSK